LGERVAFAERGANAKLVAQERGRAVESGWWGAEFIPHQRWKFRRVETGVNRRFPKVEAE